MYIYRIHSSALYHSEVHNSPSSIRLRIVESRNRHKFLTQDITSQLEHSMQSGTSGYIFSNYWREIHAAFTTGEDSSHNSTTVPPPPPTAMMTAARSTVSLWTTCFALYLRRQNSTVSACHIPRTCSSTDDCRRCTWCRPTMARPVPPDCYRSCSSLGPFATLAADLVMAAVAGSAVSSTTTARYKCPGKIPRWSRPVVLKARWSTGCSYRFVTQQRKIII